MPLDTTSTGAPSVATFARSSTGALQSDDNLLGRLVWRRGYVRQGRVPTHVPTPRSPAIRNSPGDAHATPYDLTGCSPMARARAQEIWTAHVHIPSRADDLHPAPDFVLSGREAGFPGRMARVAHASTRDVLVDLPSRNRPPIIGS
jgi:hypothetical protein